MFNRNNLSIATLAFSSESSRFAVNGILVEPSRTVVTDGHCLAIVSTPDSPVESAPKLRAGAPTKDFPPFVLGKKDCEDIAKATPKASRTTIPILANAFVLSVDPKPAKNADDEVLPPPRMAKIGTTDLDREKVFDCTILPGDFPNVDRVRTKVEDYPFSFRVDADLLCRLLKQAMNTADKRSHAVVLRLKDAQSAMRIDSQLNGQSFEGYIMPMYEDGEDREAPRVTEVSHEDTSIPQITDSQVTARRCLEVMLNYIRTHGPSGSDAALCAEVAKVIDGKVQ